MTYKKRKRDLIQAKNIRVPKVGSLGRYLQVTPTASHAVFFFDAKSISQKKKKKKVRLKLARDRCNQAPRGGISCIFEQPSEKNSLWRPGFTPASLSRSCAPWDLLVNATHILYTRSKPGQLTAALRTLERSFCCSYVPRGTSGYRPRAHRPRGSGPITKATRSLVLIQRC